ncbi:hypothetical protein Taro_043945 [Colocasia esculenta]|uniref:Endonuclease/exonuclease/phosphatase domain-containing protein n=1 Tax=Colocasia esculenta TaxID=4460 RepID=A0A843WTB8_COLES|nr:hypothetical protein [Colocasia esculenta]
MEGYAGNNGDISKIWIMWRESLDVQVVNSSDQHITVVFQRNGTVIYTFTTVYASCDQVDRRVLFDDLLNFASSVNSPWIVRGDFNCISQPSEKLGGATLTNMFAMVDFNDFILAAALIDAGYSPFTWSNNRVGPAAIKARLDRVLFNSPWDLILPSFSVTHLPRGPSDHAPLLLASSVLTRVPSRFMFQSMWLTNDSFQAVVDKAWKEADIRHPNAFVRLQVKLKVVKNTLKSWNKEVFGHVHENIVKALEEVSGLEATFDAHPSEGNN